MPCIAVSTRKLATRVIAAVVLAQFLLLAGWAFPLQGKKTAAPKAQKEDSRRQIDLLEDRWREAVLNSDANILDSLLAEDYIGIMANGTLQTKDQTLASVRADQWHIIAIDMFDRKVRFYGTTALVTSLAQVEGTTLDGNISGTYRYTRVYARDTRGVWKIVNFETNRVDHLHGQPKNSQQ